LLSHAGSSRRARLLSLLPAAQVGLHRGDYFGCKRAISHRAALAGDPDIRVLDVKDQVADSDTAHFARSRTGPGEHRGEGEIAFGPGLAPGRVRRSRGDQDAGDLGVALDVAGEGLRELRSLQAGGDQRVDAQLPLVDGVCAEARQGAMDAGPCRWRSSRPL
jgi:hypothetical protein